MKTKRIPKQKLITAWKILSRKPLPKVKALELNDKDFNQAILHKHCLEDNLRELEEWGRILSTRGTDACVFNADETENAEYIILVRENPYHSLNEIILHELSHIARGDL
ncbi:MAG: hypothetical protein ABSA75_14610 [Candidatus Bathyarchaeia archaeon]|jgi:hypothetical protein